MPKHKSIGDGALVVALRCLASPTEAAWELCIATFLHGRKLSSFEQQAQGCDSCHLRYEIEHQERTLMTRKRRSLCMAESGFNPQGFVRRFTGLGNVQRRNTEPPDDIRGPLGLRVQHDPKDPFVELIFVHGFPGGSRKSWSYNDEVTTFWPKEWLPHEDGFIHVRIHTFGYDTDWLDRKADIGKIKDYGKLLLDRIASSPYFRKNNSNPIVFVAHSLGGLVVKKAFNDAKQNPQYHDLADRFHSLIFLATPHQGLDNSNMVLRILRACSPDAKNHPVTELEPNFAAVEEINHTFKRTCRGVRLHCFYETLPLPGHANMVVDSNTASLAFADQESNPLMADHRGMARFSDSTETDYHSIRDTLAAVVEDITREFEDPDKIASQMRLLGEYLGVIDTEEEEMSALMEVPGSCEWLLEKEPFLRWRDSIEIGGSELDVSHRFRGLSTSATNKANSSEAPRIFWLSGPPGSGKSYLSAFVTHHLESRGVCTCYFLKHTDRSKQSLGGLLRSLAFQMAGRNVALRRALLAMQQEDSLTAEMNDIRVIWKQLFLQRIFRTGFQRTQYWVIDALDEGIGGHELIKLFDRIPSNLPLKIFITSRHESQMERVLRGLPTVTKNIEVQDTLEDIRLFLDENRECLHVDPTEVDILIDELVQKARGSFLWTRLILQRLDSVWERKAIAKAMREVPDDMNELYRRVLAEMAGRPNTDLAKAILRWTICAARSLTTTELQEAIQRDIDDSVAIMDRMIGDVCGQLVVIEKGKVRLVHDTARDFLLRPGLTSEFAVDKSVAHGRVADVCLRYMIEADGRQYPRTGGHANGSAVSPLHEYAHLFFSDHVVKGPSADTDAIDRVVEFLNTRILHWVEYIARRQDLHCLTQTAKNLDAWVDRRGDHSLLTKAMKFVQGWAVDLIRLVTVFGKHLLSDPACVYTVIPPLSPSGSEIYRRYGRSTVGMNVVGLSNKGWADRIFSAPFHDDFTLSTACSETCYAVGLRSGTVVLYNASTCQETARLSHGAAVKTLEFSTLNDWILVGGLNKLSLWNYRSGDPIWSVDTSSPAMALGFFEEDSIIFTATMSNHIITYRVSDGSIIRQTSWHGAERASSRARPPMRVVMSSELGLVAVIYRNQPVWLLELANLARPRKFGGQTTVSALAFNPALKMMAVGFWEGELCLFDLQDLRKGPSIPFDAQHLAVSMDGKTLLVGKNNGDISIRDFDQLSELYALRFEDASITSLVFSPNGLQILDARRKEFNVWAPSALYRRKDSDDTGSQGRTSYGTALTQQYPNYSTTDASLIYAIACHHNGEYIFCGRADGSVSVHDVLRGRFICSLFSHAPMSITFVEWNASREVLISSDTSNRIMVHKAQLAPKRTESGMRTTWQTSKFFERRLDLPIRQILGSVDGEYLLVSDPSTDHVWTMKGDIALTHQCRHPEPTRTPSQKWTTHPRHQRRFYEIESDGVNAATWSPGSTSSPTTESIETRPHERVDLETGDSGIHFVKFGETMWAAYDNKPFTRPIVWDTPNSHDSDTTTETTLERFKLFAPQCQYLIGIYRSQLVFLKSDDWVSSMRIEDEVQSLYTRHFPVPYCWQSSSRGMLAIVTSRGDVVIAKSDELAIVKKGLSL